MSCFMSFCWHFDISHNFPFLLCLAHGSLMFFPSYFPPSAGLWLFCLSECSCPCPKCRAVCDCSSDWFVQTHQTNFKLTTLGIVNTVGAAMCPFCCGMVMLCVANKRCYSFLISPALCSPLQKKGSPACSSVALGIGDGLVDRILILFFFFFFLN